MGKSKTDHVVIRNQKLFCSNCGREQIVPYPIEIPVFVAMGKAFSKSHANCANTWTEPVVDPSLSEIEKAEFWYDHGERGSSSEYMYSILSGKSQSINGSYPHDPSDFKRCHGLLLMVPEWRSKLDDMRRMSLVWNNLVDNWDKLTEMLLEQMASKKDNGMYDFMKTLGC